ncbi:MAG TPA: TolC family protein [Flavitalea sp.]|nr:TolC family protein [Flavitalea sp.]
MNHFDMTIFMNRKLYMRSIPVLLLATLAITASAQDTTYAMSVKQAVEYATENSYPVKNAMIGIDLQRQQNREITAAAYPQLNGSANTSYFPNVAVQSFPNFIAAAAYGVLVQEGVKTGAGNPIVAPSDFGFVEAQFGTKYTASGGVDLSQLLFDGQVFVGLQARKTAIQFASKTADVTKEQIKANVYKIYYQLQAGKQQIGTIDANITRFEKLLNDTKEIFKNGFAEKLDVSKAEVSLTNLRTEKLKIQNRLETGYLGLKMLMGMPLQAQLTLTDSLPENIFSQEILDTKFQYSERVEHEQLDLNRKLNEYNIRRFKLSYLPTVSLSTSYYKLAQRNEFNFFKTGEPWFPSSSIALRINVPIFDGFAKAARVRTAQLQLEQTNNNLKNLELSIDREISETRINLRSAVAAMVFQKKNMALAEDVYNQTKLKYEQGLGSNLEITNSQAELTTAQNNYYSALYDAIVSRVDYLRATGKL